MFVIEAENDRGWRWISAICLEQQTAESFLASIPEALRSHQRLIEIAPSVWPLFILEDRGFEYGDAALARQRLAQLQPSANDDDVLLNVYVIRKDFLPKHPGKDSMGVLRHWHITNWHLANGMRNLQGEHGLTEALREATQNAGLGDT